MITFHAGSVRRTENCSLSKLGSMCKSVPPISFNWLSNWAKLFQKEVFFVKFQLLKLPGADEQSLVLFLALLLFFHFSILLSTCLFLLLFLFFPWKKQHHLLLIKGMMITAISKEIKRNYGEENDEVPHYCQSIYK